MRPRNLIFFSLAAINLDPTNRAYLWQRASVYCEMNEHKKAIESFEMLLKVGFMFVMGLQ